MTGYVLTQQEHRNLKSKLTRAINSGDADTIERTVTEAFAIFDAKGYPDDWSRWTRARDDARLKARFA